ncbi:MAG: right-handed parallel beta-helix repeat-containing protein, partial [Spirochaetia bacterium]
MLFAAYPGEEPVLDGKRIRLKNTWTGLINVNRRHDIIIEGFSVRDSPARGIMVSDSGRVTVRNNTTENTVFSGIQAWGNESLVIDGNTIINACTGDEEIVGGTQEHISVSHSSDFEITGNIAVYGNILHDNAECGIT